jgi:hypothetical protein
LGLKGLVVVVVVVLKRNGREKVVPGEKKKEALALQQYGDRNLPVSQ